MHILTTNAARHIAKARRLRKQFGMVAAAGYLRNRAYSTDFALYVLLGTGQRFTEHANRNGWRYGLIR